MSAVLRYDAWLESQTCGECGIEFAAPRSFWKHRREHGVGWYCPNGHSRIFRETDSEKVQREMQEQLDQEKNRTEFYQREANQQRAYARKLKGQLTRERKRVGNGVCPCCKRSFVNLQRHMAGQHPDFSVDQAAAVE